MRTSLAFALRKPVGVTVTSNDMMKYGDFLSNLPLPTSLNILRMEPLKGNILLVLESKLVFCLVDILFGGSGGETYKIEGREFTNIENRLVRNIVDVMMKDLKEAWKNVLPVSLHFVRSEINPQFAAIVPSDDIVLVINFELEMESSTGKVTLCLPYAGLEPIKDKLQGLVQTDQLEVDSIWTERFRNCLKEVPVEIVVELGKADVTGREVLDLNIGDVIQLGTYSKDKLMVKVENSIKFAGYPGFHRGNQAIQISNSVERRY
jgi:flagellar motor switch protein FliM